MRCSTHHAHQLIAAAGAALCLLAGAPLAAETVVAPAGPPFGNSTKITVIPAAPTTADLVVVAVESTWSDGCTPGFTGLEVELGTTGLRYVVTLTGGPARDEGCPAAVTPFKAEAPLGHVPEGTHEVIVQGKQRDLPQFFVEFGTKTFTVTAGAAPAELVLHGGRFRVEVAWTDFAGKQGAGRVVPGAGMESGLFWYFTPGNWELLIKLLDACALNGRWWVLGAAATNVGYEITVRDTLTGDVWTYENPLGTRSPAILDTDAFDGCS
jgi:hypothetical protein